MSALRRLRLRAVLEGSRRSMLSTARRIMARLRAEWSLRTRHSSSRNATSKTQCRLWMQRVPSASCLEPRTVLPSMATTPRMRPARLLTQTANAVSNCRGSSRAAVGGLEGPKFGRSLGDFRNNDAKPWRNVSVTLQPNYGLRVEATPSQSMFGIQKHHHGWSQGWFGLSWLQSSPLIKGRTTGLTTSPSYACLPCALFVLVTHRTLQS